jgi:hypothetical protein
MHEGMTEKRCPRCGEMKPLDDYYRNRREATGREARCKSCERATRNLRYQTDPVTREKAKVLQRDRYQRLSTEDYAVYRKKRQEEQRQWRHLPRAREAAHTRQQTAQWKAKQAVAVATGKLPAAKTLVCVTCGQPAKEYHHESYLPEHWLSVIAFCVKCHHAVHAH